MEILTLSPELENSSFGLFSQQADVQGLPLPLPLAHSQNNLQQYLSLFFCTVCCLGMP